MDLRGHTAPSWSPPTPGARVVYWLLIGMGLAAFTPCILLPEWRAYQSWQVAQQAQQHRLDQLERAAEHEQRVWAALQSDPGAIDRLAQRDLGFRRWGQRTVRVSLPDEENQPWSPAGSIAFDVPFEPKPVLPPPFVARSLSHLPDLNYDGVFCDNRTRPMVMCLSVGLIIFSLWWFGRPQSVFQKAPEQTEPRP